MRYKTFLILFLTCFAGLQPAFAENDRYRVEILVLTHLGHAEQPREALSLEDFSSAVDFLQPPEEDDTTSHTNAQPEQAPVAEAEPPVAEQSPLDGDPAFVDADDADDADARDAVVHVEEMGEEMQEAWRRLRASGPFRPLQYLAWEQGSNPPFPTLRVHDSEAVRIDDPWAEQRLLQDAAGPPAAGSAGPANGTFGTPPEVPDPGDYGEEQTLPDPVVYYRLDGTARLTRSRFLHLNLKIEWREPEFAPTPAVVNTLPAAPTGTDDLRRDQQPERFLVHRLEQSRPVRSGRMEYFDGPVLGVLAWISNVTEATGSEPID